MKNNTTSSKTQTTRSNKKTYGWIIGSVVLLYIIGLINPITGNYLKYPYYELFCGRKPVVALSFMGSKTYQSPDTPGYRVTNMSSVLYCTENEARANGYSLK